MVKNLVLYANPRGMDCKNIHRKNHINVWRGRNMRRRIISVFIVVAVIIIAITPVGAVVNPFSDITRNHPWYDAVLWAYESGVTKGTDATNFNPYSACTRGQVVTFLWNYAGKPTPAIQACQFTDVKQTDYFYMPVLWAVSEGITSGTTETTFSPEAYCTTGQVLTFLWRASGCRSASGSSTLAAEYPERYYTQPLAWAETNEILKDTFWRLFDPEGYSSRSNIVQYLYNFAGAPEVKEEGEPDPFDVLYDLIEEKGKTIEGLEGITAFVYLDPFSTEIQKQYMLLPLTGRNVSEPVVWFVLSWTEDGFTTHFVDEIQRFSDGEISHTILMITESDIGLMLEGKLEPYSFGAETDLSYCTYTGPIAAKASAYKLATAAFSEMFTVFGTRIFNGYLDGRVSLKDFRLNQAYKEAFGLF